VDVRAGGFAGDGGAEGKKRDAIGGKILPQPHALRLIRVDSHVDAAAVVET
jgi:hypothetical protein